MPKLNLFIQVEVDSEAESSVLCDKVKTFIIENFTKNVNVNANYQKEIAVDVAKEKEP